MEMLRFIAIKIKNDLLLSLLSTPMTNIEFTSGLGAGFLSAIIFNPIDKAIYLSTTKDLKITNSNLWKGLYKGSSLSILTRIITSGLYFSYIDYYSSVLNSNFQVASITALSCLITNPLQIIKFKSWYSDSSITDTYFHIKNKYGYRGFMIGGSSLFMRDLVFNYIYLSLKKKDEHLNNIGGICLALVAVAPLNLIKNKKYGNNESLKNITKNFKFSQLGISYSVIRMGLGFYTSQYLYDSIKSTLSS
jgi:hypothetical protein